MCVDAWRAGISICGMAQEVRLVDLLKFLDLNSSASVIMTIDDVFNRLGASFSAGRLLVGTVVS